jgi:pyridine nucleotide-disulfide oxidoreductase
MVSSKDCQVAVIGAGPYGLSAAAHLRFANVSVAVFGRAMDFWQNHMPAGMLLRSPWEASHFSDPLRCLTLDSYYAQRRLEKDEPIALETFVQYGKWFQQTVAPDLDRRYIVTVEKQPTRFRLLLEDGDSCYAERVIIATGIGSFAHRPAMFDCLPPELVSHACDHRDLSRFNGKYVAVIGGGQSALESAALLAENGAEVELIVRAPKIRWLHAREVLRHPWNPLRKLFFHPTDVGPALYTQISARPPWFRLLPPGLQGRFAQRCIRPAGAAWLKHRFGPVHVTTQRSVVAAQPVGERLSLRLTDGSQRNVDHLLLATGYRVDILRHGFLPASLGKQIEGSGGYPELTSGFECSVPGLHFLGAPAAASFGPLMRFVSGSAFAAAALTRCVTGEKTLQKTPWRTGWRLSNPQVR